MNRLLIPALLLGLVVSVSADDQSPSPSDAKPAGEPDRTGPLADLPSEPGPHVAKIKALGDNQWLALGAPKADPKWGRARGRSWSAKMAFAPDLRGAFLFGEGVHGWWNRATNRYMDDLWFYDVPGHRWVCAYPGMKVNAYPAKVSEHGFEADAGGRPLPVASMVHAYEMVTYDTHRRCFMSMPCPGNYWSGIKGRREFARKNHSAIRPPNASPWIYDTVKGQWDRRVTKQPTPPSGFGDALIYLAPHKKVFQYRRGQNPRYYDPAENTWTAVKAKGPRPPFGIDFTACYDPKADRIYLGGGSYPVAKGDNALWILDVKTNTWIDPKPEGKPCGGSHSYATNIAMMHYDSANNVVVLIRHKGKAAETGVFIYDPEANRWTTASEGMPKGWGQTANGFYDSKLNAHFVHVAHDSRDNGVIFVYRYGQVNKQAN
jgi:hypothetical protein